MSYSDLLNAIARYNGIPTAAELVSTHGHKHQHLIKSRERARELLATYRALLDVSFSGRNVVDLGSGIGSLAIELFHLGAEVTAIEPSARWLGMSEDHAKNEATSLIFVKADLLHGLEELQEKSFDLILAVDSLPRIYDLYRAAERLRELLKPGGAIAFRIPNATAPTTIDDKRGLGLPLIPPDYWSAFVKSPVGQYHRPWAVYRALLKEAGFQEPVLSVPTVDETVERARYKVRAGLSEIKKTLKAKEGLSDPKAYIYARNALKPYIRTAEQELDTLSWEALNLKYRAPTLVGVARTA